MLLMLATLTTALASSATLDLTISADGASFKVAHDGSPWLSSSDVIVDGFSASAKTLVTMGAPQTASGTDALGAFKATAVEWALASAPSATVMVATYKQYPADSSFVVFEQTFPSAREEYKTPADAIYSWEAPSFAPCRVVAGSVDFELTPSVDKYSAFTPSKSGGPDDEHSGDYCETTPEHDWVYTGNENQTACAAKCAALKCACYDVAPPGPGPSPSPTKLAARTIFPSFDKKLSKQLDAFAYHNLQPGLEDHTLANYKDSHMGGQPLVLYDHANSSLPMVVFSPLNQPMAHHMAADDTLIGAGVKDSIKDIPAGWKQSFILSAGVGIKDGMMAWGDHMLAHTGKKRADMYKDDTHGKIGFWTDNGGFYHYAVGTNASVGTTYMEVLPKVKAYHDDIGIPFGHWQFDSWFYPKDGGTNPGGGGGSVTNWTNGGQGCSTDKTCFGKQGTWGMQAIQDVLKLPTVMHNRQWSTKSDYIKNLDFEWYLSKYAIMKDPEAFFEWFFKQQDGWGLSMYEQDWLCTEYDGVTELQTNITLGDAWLKGMADGAESSGRSVQYCMAYANQVLSAASYSAVTNARATGDYFHATNQWAVGATSLFYWAIGILPFKDGFYSSNNKQVGGQTQGPEKDPDRETLMATLSCAMVGPMDGIFLLNKTRIMTTCMADGTVLKPDAPVHTSDSCFLSAKGDGCYVYHAESAVSGYGTVHYAFNNEGGAPLTPRDTHLAAADVGKYVVRNWYTGAVAVLAASTPLAAGYEGHNYASISPIVNGWVFFGEVGKYVVAAAKRFPSVIAQGEALTAEVNGIKGETVKVCAAKSSDMKTICNTLTFKATGEQTTTF